jgi:dihydroxy-acid dehydratase
MGENCRARSKARWRRDPPYDKPLGRRPASWCCKGNLFDSAIMKTSVISEEFRDRYLSIRRTRTRSRAAPSCSTGRRIITTASTIPRSEDRRALHPVHARHRADRLSRRRRGREHAAAAALIKRGILSLPCIGDGRQSGTSGSPSILNASPEAPPAAGCLVARHRVRVVRLLPLRLARAIISAQVLLRREPDHRLHLRAAGFAAGFAVRPFGALVFGRLGDLVGRKYTFLVTILIMGCRPSSSACCRAMPRSASRRRSC